LKNLVHSIRYLLLGIQILKFGKIKDYTIANEYHKKIFEMNFDT